MLSSSQPISWLVQLESAQGWIAQPAAGGGMGRQGEGAKSPGQTSGPGRTNADGQTDRRTCLNGSNPPPQVNAKCDVVMKLSVFGTRILLVG